VPGDGGVADDDKVLWPRGKAVHGPFLAEPLEERQEERAAEEVPHIIELGGCDGDPRVVAAAPADRARERREPVGARPRGGIRGLVAPAASASRRGRADADTDVDATRRRTWGRRRRQRRRGDGGGGEDRGRHRRAPADATRSARVCRGGERRNTEGGRVGIGVRGGAAAVGRWRGRGDWGIWCGGAPVEVVEKGKCQLSCHGVEPVSFPSNFAGGFGLAGFLMCGVT
jgi:hypothetical protein